MATTMTADQIAEIANRAQDGLFTSHSIYGFIAVAVEERDALCALAQIGLQAKVFAEKIYVTIDDILEWAGDGLCSCEDYAENAESHEPACAVLALRDLLVALCDAAPTQE
jgi:hypothetical protein